MTANPYQGEVQVVLDGQPVTFKFTWRARAMLRQIFGETWIDRVSNAIVTLNCADLAIILDAITDGEITIDQAMQSDWPMVEIRNAIRQSFQYSHHGLIEPVEDKESPNVLKPQKTQSFMLSKALAVLGFHQKNFGN